MEDNNKKTLILSIVGILVLVIAVVGVSFAMYSFTGTVNKENIIQTGTVSMNFDNSAGMGANNFTLENKYPMSDAKGIVQTDNKATFGVTATWGSAEMTIKYDLAVVDIVAGTTLTAEHIKIALVDSTGNVLVGNTGAGTTLTSGVTIKSLENEASTNGLFENYALASGTLTSSGQSDKYTVSAYVADTYDLPTDSANTVNEGVNHKKTTKSETFSFKIGVKAKQV